MLDTCGAGEAVRAAGQRIARMRGVEATRGRRVLDVAAYRPQTQGLAIHRAALDGALIQAVPPKACKSPPPVPFNPPLQTGQLRILTMRNGTTHGPFDLVIDATGSSSELSSLQGHALPYGAIWGTVPWPNTKLPSTQLW